MNPKESFHESNQVPRFIANGREYPLSDAGLRIGRAADNDVVIEHESVSSHHALISGNRENVMVTDLQSTNGTFINGQRVMVAPISGIVELSVGSVHCSFATSQSGEQTVLNDGCDEVARISPPPLPSEAKTGSSEAVKPLIRASEFSVMPRSDRGRSIMVAFVVITFFNWLYMPVGMVLILLLGFGILTGIRYYRYRHQASKAQALNPMQTAAKLPDTRPLWKRPPFITAVACMLLEIVLNDEASSSSARLMQVYSQRFALIQKDSGSLNSFGSTVARGIEAFAYGYAGDTSRGYQLDREVDMKNQSLEEQASQLSYMYQLTKESKEASDLAVNVGILCLFGLGGYLIYDHRKRAVDDRDREVTE
jgi:hypothetical protein